MRTYPYALHNMECIAAMRSMPDNSVDSIVTDPPYELTSARPGGRSAATEGKVMKGFMGMAWDGSGIAYSVEMWREALRVLKPGGHLLAFSGSRTYHRMTCAIEDAGFEVRDQIMWVYGSGFPKSLDVSKAIDKAAGARGHDSTRFNAVGQQGERTTGGDKFRSDHPDYVKPQAVTEAARQWEGWGTALKPAHEPICVARKPLIGTVAANVLAHGTGAMNIEGCRVGTEDMSAQWDRAWKENTGEMGERYGQGGREAGKTVPPGRWPANLIHDGSDEVLALFPTTTSGAMKAGTRRAAQDEPGSVCYGTYGGNATTEEITASSGSAARFFYQAKCSKADRNSGLDGIVEVIIEWNDSTTGELKWDSEARQVKLWVVTGLSVPRVTAVFGAPSSSVTEWNTMLSGNEPMGLSLLDSTYTTSTKTNCTTPSEILNFFQNCITNGNTADVNCEMESGGSPAGNAGSCSTLMLTTNEWMVLALGANRAVWPMRLKISASAATSGHPTVKPTDLMAYLVRLVTPPGGLVLDPFMGSGSTGKACMREGFRFVGCELSAEYATIARARIEHEIVAVAVRADAAKKVADLASQQVDMFA